MNTAPGRRIVVLRPVTDIKPTMPFPADQPAAMQMQAWLPSPAGSYKVRPRSCSKATFRATRNPTKPIIWDCRYGLSFGHAWPLRPPLPPFTGQNKKDGQCSSVDSR